ncbi:Peptidase A1 domain-containing protein [Aphelenchoides besseyi]|nr:Peptidase A1 domain-containing protein [Aphelenchoides besseyi]
MNSSNYDALGEITFGGYDTEKCPGALSTVPLIGDDWKFLITGFITGKYEINDDFETKVDLYTGSGWFGAPDELLQNLYVTTGAYYDSSAYGYVVDCELKIPLTFKTKSVNIVLQFHEYTVKKYGKCVLAFYKTETKIRFDHLWLQSYCAIVDVNSRQFSFTHVAN